MPVYTGELSRLLHDAESLKSCCQTPGWRWEDWGQSIGGFHFLTRVCRRTRAPIMSGCHSRQRIRVCIACVSLFMDAAREKSGRRRRMVATVEARGGRCWVAAANRG